MTAVDPRVGEIENRLKAATPGPWKANKDGTIDGTDYAEVICRGQVDCMSYCYGGSSTIEGDNLAADAEFIAHSPSDVAYLLAELRKRDEALAGLVANSPRLPNDVRSAVFEAVFGVVEKFNFPAQNMGPHKGVVEIGDVCGEVEKRVVAFLRAGRAAVTGDGA